MNEKTELWLQEIRRRTERKRKRYRKRNCSCLIAMNMMLMIGIGMLLQNVTTLGIAEVAEGFGSVLIRGEVSVYVVIGIAAFVCGVIFTIVCIRWQKNRRNKESGDT